MKVLSEKPILFSTDMVKAILDGKKTITRRVIKARELFEMVKMSDGTLWPIATDYEGRHHENYMKCPYQADRLWVRETFCISTHTGGEPWVRYRATDKIDVPPGTKWKPSIFMPRWASRINLEVLSIRAERLQDITIQDVIAEGIPVTEKTNPKPRDGRLFLQLFAELWDSLNEKRGYGWDKNPWVWRVEFKTLY